jgi:hypothetical protein
VKIAEAKRIAFGSTPAASLKEWHDAWQWLYDNDVELKQPDIDYLDKLICDGDVLPRHDYFSTIDT